MTTKRLLFCAIAIMCCYTVLEAQEKITEFYSIKRAYRLVDKEYRVVCYANDFHRYSQSLSCVKY